MKKAKPNFWRAPKLSASIEATEKAMSGKRARAKGLNFERQVAQLLRPIFPGARRWLENHRDDAKGIDIVGTGPFKIQCKKMKKYATVATIKEVQCEPALGDIPILITAGDGQPPMAVMSFSDFIWLVGYADLGMKKGFHK